MGPKLYTLAEIADELRYGGSDRERSVRRLFARHGVSMVRRDRFFVTERQYTALLEAMTCSQSAGVAVSITCVARSASGARNASSKSIDGDDLVRLELSCVG
jgi:hypothetical protein